MWDTIANLASNLGSSLFGGKGGRDKQNEATALNYHMWQQSQAMNQAAFRETLNLQKQTNKHQIAWRVADAKNAGLHPLAALGINPGGGPSSQNFSAGQVDTPMLEDDTGPSLGAMGQDISSALLRSMTRQERQNERENAAIGAQNRFVSEMLGEQQLAAGDQALIRGNLENEILAAQLARIATRSGTQIGPPAAGVEVVPDQVIASQPGHAEVQAGTHPEFMHTDIGRGRVAVRMSPQVTQSLENDLLGNVQWQLENRILPHWGVNLPPKPDPKKYPLGENEMWMYKNQSWRKIKTRPSIWSKRHVARVGYNGK